MSGTVGLRDRGEKIILVKRVGAEVTNADEQEHTSVVVMESVIQTYREVYSNDLEERIGINTNDRLPTALGLVTLLNPMFGLKPIVIGAGLMNESQYDKA